jgi:hypothetical protein
MRIAIVSFVALLALLAPMHSVAAANLASASYQDTGQPTKDFNVDIDVNRGGGGVWYTSPLWIAIGVVAVILLVALIALASRGGGTTVVKD